MLQTAGYSGSPLEKKLGLKSGFVIRLINSPDHYFELFQAFPTDIEVQSDTKSPKDFIHFFTKERAELEEKLPRLKQEIKANGMIWVSWPKKASQAKTGDQSQWHDLGELAQESFPSAYGYYRRYYPGRSLSHRTGRRKSMRGRYHLVRAEAGNSCKGQEVGQ